MRTLRASDAAEYATWYLERDREKDASAPIPQDGDESLELMKSRHAGKWLDWFDAAAWSIVAMDEEDFGRLIFLESSWTKDAGLTVPDRSNYRLLSRVGELAIERNYLAVGHPRHRRYYTLLECGLQLTGGCRVMLRPATDGERSRNPDGDYYLMDGAGRCLPYVIQLLEGVRQFDGVEAFLATQGAEVS
jgi:hypothetical protein